jgi:hypothetical protein
MDTTFKVARLESANGGFGQDDTDSKGTLEKLGFSILDADEKFYHVLLPPGWAIAFKHPWTFFESPDGSVLIEQYDDVTPGLPVTLTVTHLD